MYVVGTAGHVDHGKSTLIRALTGMDPDRLQEEKLRGMTIDLGFAWLTLPSGKEVSIVDVPGHERFIKNMLAGVGGIDLAVLVIAADEGIMPQTEEHLAILELVQVKRAIVALTKIDLVEGEWLDLVVEDVTDRLERSRLRGASIVAVSGATGQGLENLLAELDSALDQTPRRIDRGRPRIPIDRVFTIPGFGTVITGTLIDGSLRVGQELEIQPGGHSARIRNLQMHHERVEVAEPGSRVATNLVGVAPADLRRGQVATTAGWLRPTRALDASLGVIEQARALRHNATVSFHTGAAETLARVVLLEADELRPGSEGWAQLHLEEPVALAKGDRFVLRTPNETVGGGEVVEPFARRHRRRRPAVVERLRLLQSGTPEDLVIRAIEEEDLADQATIAASSGLTSDQVLATLHDLRDRQELVKVANYYATRASWQRLSERVCEILAHYHQRYRLRGGMPREELKSRLGLGARPFNQVLHHIASNGEIVVNETSIRLASHAATFDSDQRRKIDQLLQLLGRHRYAPPSLSDLSTKLAVDAEVIAALVEQRQLHQIDNNIVFLAEAYDEMVEKVTDQLRANGSITVAEVRDLFQTSRKYALALMEHLDEQRITRRVGDTRVLR